MDHYLHVSAGKYTSRRSLVSRAMAMALVGVITFALTSQVHAGNFTPSVLNTAYDGTVETIPLQVTATTVSPPSITIETWAPGTFTISRKDPSSNTWTQVATTGALAANGTWTDTNVTVGTLYEYQFVNTASTPYANDSGYPIYATGYILTGIQVDQTQPKGMFAVITANDLPVNLPTEYAQYKADLVADGWQVREIQVPRCPDNYSGLGNGALNTVTVTNGGTTSIASGSIVYLTNSSGKVAEGTLTVNGSGAITAVSSTVKIGGVQVWGNVGAGFHVGDALTMSGGQVTIGTQASITANVTPTGSILNYASPQTGGSGYTNGQTVTMTGQTSGASVQVNISAPTGGVITGFTFPYSSTGFIQGELLTMTGNTTGSGIGPMTALVSSGQLFWIYIKSTGTGYTQGEAAVLTGNQSGATAQVTLNLNQGYLNGVNVVTSQSGFISGETLTLSGTATGSGAPLFKSNVIAAGPLQSVTVGAGGTGYTNGAVIQITDGLNIAQGTLSVTSGAITGINITSSGTGFYQGDNLTLLPVTSVTPTLSILTLNNSNRGSPVAITAGGSGYSDNDTVTIKGNTSGATAVGSLIAPSGSIAGISVVLANTGAAGSFTTAESLTITPTLGGSGASATVGAPLDNHLLIRSAVQAVYNAYPGQLKNVVMVGKVPVCRSGINDGSSADGHGNECPYGADAFYAEMLGTIGIDWTDTQDNTSNVDMTDYNLPGDMQFDQQTIAQVKAIGGTGTGMVQLGFGRIDLACGIYTEVEADRCYFNKLHLYKIADPSFLPGRNVCDRLSFTTVRETELQSMPGVVGMNNVTFTTVYTLPPVTAAQDADQLYSTQNGPYLFYFKGDGYPYAGVNGKAVFWTGMQSHYGFWYETYFIANGMQLRLGENSFTLDFTWDVFGLRYLYHRMGMGLDAGDMMKTSINNQGFSTGPYTYKYNGEEIGGDFNGTLCMDQMGDPALRLFMFAPPTALSIGKSTGNPVLTWTASTEPTVTGYHVYRAPNANGTFTRLTTTPVPSTGPLTYTDSSATSGSYVYMVRAVRLESTGGGSFYNASLGVTQSFNVSASPTPVTVLTTSLPQVYWNTPTTLTLSAQGGDPQYVWSIPTGSLPAGLTLSPATGVISGTTQLTGSFNFSVQATDQILQQSAPQALTLTVGQNTQSANILPTQTTYTSSSFSTSAYGNYEVDDIQGGLAGTTPVETFQKYDLSGVNPNNGIAKATVYLYVTSATVAGAYAPVQANLIADSADGWVANGISLPFSGYSNNGAGKVRIACTNHGLTTGTLVTIAGLTGSGAPTAGPYAATVVDANTFDLLTVNYVAGWTYTASTAKVTTTGITYNTRPTTYDPNVPTITGTGTLTSGSVLQFDVTSFVKEALTFPDKQMGIRFFTGTNQLIGVGSLNSYGNSIPYLVIQTSNAPKIVVNSPTTSPAYLYTGSSIVLNTTVTAIPARASNLSLQWSQVSGPGTTTFTAPTATVTGASFSTPGVYVLQLTANDGVETSSQTITVVAQNYAVSGPTDSMVLRLPFDETSGTTAHDYSGVSPANNGTLTADPASNTLPTWTSSGKIAGVLSFAGSNSPANFQQVVVPDSATNPLDGMQQMALSFWFYANAFPPDSGNFAGLVVKQLGLSNKESYAVKFRGSTATSATLYWDIGGAGGYILSIPKGQWYHCVLQFDGTHPNNNNAQLYLNGFPASFVSTAQTSVPRNPTANLHIGAFDTSYSLATYASFNGLIDEVRIYNRILTLAEIQALYQGVPSDTGPVITAASPLSGQVGAPLSLTASVTGQGTLTYNWSQLNGPATLNITNAMTASATTTPSQPGGYGFQFTANDGTITSFANVAATITGQTFSSWAAANGLTGNNALMTAVLEPDGLNNLFKYALGLNPTTIYNPGDPHLPSVAVQNISGTNYLTMTFTGVATDVTYKVQATSDLNGTWTTIQTYSSGGTAPGTVTVQDSQAVGVTPKRFMRLLMTSP